LNKYVRCREMTGFDLQKDSRSWGDAVTKIVEKGIRPDERTGGRGRLGSQEPTKDGAS